MKSVQEMHFLIVDDMDNMRRSIRAMLKLIGFGKEYVDAANGADALEILVKEQAQVDFIISDINMPKMTGTELLHRVRENKKTRDLPFLMITAEANQEVVAEAAEQEVDGYLTKPFVTASLEQKIKELLHNAENPPPLTVKLRLARILEEQDRIDEAIVAMKEAISLNPQSSRPFRELGRLFLKKGDSDSALKCFKKAVEINCLDVPSYHYLGQLYYKAGDIDKAIVNFTRAMEISPRHTDRSIHFGKLLLEKKRFAEAEKVFRLVLRTCNDDTDIQEDIAEACFDAGLMPLAARLYTELLRKDPERFYLNKKLGIALHSMGKLQTAVQVLEKAATQLGDDVELFVEIAKIYLEMKVIMKADSWAAKVVRIDSTNTEARAILDKCLDF